MGHQYTGEVMDEFRKSIPYLAEGVNDQNIIVVLGISVRLI
jgi:hypothetical protein